MPSLTDTCSVVLENIISDEKLLENHVAIFKEEQVLMICQGFFFYTFNSLVSIVHSTVSGFVDTRLQKIL